MKKHWITILYAILLSPCLSFLFGFEGNTLWIITFVLAIAYAVFQIVMYNRVDADYYLEASAILKTSLVPMFIEMALFSMAAGLVAGLFLPIIGFFLGGTVVWVYMWIYLWFSAVNMICYTFKNQDRTILKVVMIIFQFVLFWDTVLTWALTLSKKKWKSMVVGLVIGIVLAIIVAIARNIISG